MQTINEYIAVSVDGKIVKKANSPVVGLALVVLGAAMLLVMSRVGSSDSLQMVVLTVGVAALAVGLVLVAMCLSKTLWHYEYLPSHSRMARVTRYLDAANYRRCLDALSAGDVDALAQLQTVVSSNFCVQLVVSRRHDFALLQAGSLDTGHFVPDSEVVCFSGKDVETISVLCK